MLARVRLGGSRVRRGQSRRELLRRLVPVTWIFSERRRDDTVHPTRKIFPYRRRARRIFGEALHEAFLPGEGRFPREHLEQHATETIGIAPPVELFVAHQLFGAHVGWSPRTAPSRARKLANAGEIDRTRNSEVGENRMTGRQQNVLRLDVAMDDALGVCVGQRVGDVAGDVARNAGDELSLAIDPLAQSFAAHVRHHIVEECLDVPRVVKRENVWVLKLCQEPDFANEAKLSGL